MKVLITGGTGTLGQELTRQLQRNNHSVYILSRDENKQKQMALDFTRLKFIVADITNRRDLDEVSRIKEYDFDHVFHCAAMKHIEVCEKWVNKCVETNFHGTVNVYQYFGWKARNFTFFTTDKAVAPINAYGHAKALSEHYLADKKNVNMFRWGNIIGSTGSFIPYLTECALRGERVNITNPNMTRFWVYIDDAAKFVMKNWQRPFIGAIYPEMKACKLIDVVRAIEMLTKKTVPKFTIDRDGEKTHECMYADCNGPKIYSHENVINAQQMKEYLEKWYRKYLKNRKT